VLIRPPIIDALTVIFCRFSFFHNYIPVLLFLTTGRRASRPSERKLDDSIGSQRSATSPPRVSSRVSERSAERPFGLLDVPPSQYQFIAKDWSPSPSLLRINRPWISASTRSSISVSHRHFACGRRPFTRNERRTVASEYNKRALFCKYLSRLIPSFGPLRFHLSPFRRERFSQPSEVEIVFSLILAAPPYHGTKISSPIVEKLLAARNGQFLLLSLFPPMAPFPRSIASPPFFF